jgi:hypothetical protein
MAVLMQLSGEQMFLQPQHCAYSKEMEMLSDLNCNANHGHLEAQSEACTVAMSRTLQTYPATFQGDAAYNDAACCEAPRQHTVLYQLHHGP